MGLFGNKSKPAKRRSGGTTIIAAGTTLVGELSPEGNVHIDGRIEGQIDSASDVSIGAEGSFEGEIRAHRMVVSGYARGRIECDSLEIVNKGRVLGEVSSRSFVIEPGGQFVGESRSTDEESVAQLSHWHGQERSGADGSASEAGAEPEPESEPVPEPEPVVHATTDEVDMDEPVVTGIDEQVDGSDDEHHDREPTVAFEQNEADHREDRAAQNQRRWR